MVPTERPFVRIVALAVACGAFAWLAPTPAVSQGVESEAGEKTADSPDDSPETSQSEPVWLGVQIAEENDGDAGAAVTEVLDESPAARAGLESDDRILTVDGNQVGDLSALREALSSHAPGDEIALTVQRGDQKQTLTATLSARPTESTVMRRQLVGSSLPEVAFTGLDGNRLEPADHRGKPLVLEFWATWCAPCRAIQKTLGKLDDKFGDRIKILGVSAEKRRVLRKYRREHKSPYSIVRDPGEAAHEKLLVSRYPTIIVVDSEGTIAEVFIGVDHREELTKTLERMVGSEETNNSTDSEESKESADSK